MKRAIANFSRIFTLGFVLAGGQLATDSAYAMDLDWSGQFRSEAHWVKNYQSDSSPAGRTRDAARDAAGGYYIPGGGAENANFQTLFLRLRPKLVVNDNVYIKSEWWLGDPVFGFFGDAFPGSFDQRQYYSNQSRGSFITAQRFWAELLSDVGTVQIGRAPLHWGLGIVWNSGDGLWDRYMSTGDTIRLISKFGAFSFLPSITKYSMGNNVGGASDCTTTPGTCTVLNGGGGLSDYSLALKYENPDEEFEGGVQFIKRIGGPAQDPGSGVLVPADVGGTNRVGGSNFNIWDIYARKKIGKLNLGGEVPVVSGDLGGVDYKTFAFAAEAGFKFNDTWELETRLGRAPGQPNTTNTRPDRLRAFFFNPNYKLGLIMFNYQRANFAGPNTQNNTNVGRDDLLSPFDNPITNANYLSVGGLLHADKWHFHTHFITAQATETAAPNQNFFNSNRRQFFANTTGTTQDKSLGSEIDFGTAFQWDETFQAGVDIGWYWPGAFYRFSNTATENPTETVFAAVGRIGISF